MAAHRLDASVVHHAWDNALAPRLEVAPGDTVVFDTRDAADGFYSRRSTHDDVIARGPFRGHPLTGPVRVRGARPGDALVVDVVDRQFRGAGGDPGGAPPGPRIGIGGTEVCSGGASSGSGVSRMLRNWIGPNSDSRPIRPGRSTRLMPSLTSRPFTHTLIVLPTISTSAEFHSPTGFSASAER